MKLKIINFQKSDVIEFKRRLHSCHLCGISFKNNEKILLKRSSKTQRYHPRCAMKVNLLEEDHAVQ